MACGPGNLRNCLAHCRRHQSRLGQVAGKVVGPIGEGRVGRSGTDDTLLTPERVSKASVRGRSRRGQEEEGKAA